MGFVKIKLLPYSMIGRRFQYAFASLSLEGVNIRYESDEIIFPDETSYVNTVKLALKSILDMYTLNKPVKGCNPINVHGIDCCRLRGGPKLYGNDYRDIKNMKLDKCSNTTPKGEVKYTWTHLAVSYALEVMERGGPLRDQEEFGVPSLAKASLFSRTRGLGKPPETKKLKANKDTIGTMLLGGSLSFLGSYNVSRKGRDQLEFYLLPDMPSRAYSTLLQIASIHEFSNNLAGIIASLIKNLGVSIEASVMLALAVLLYRNEDLVSKIEGGTERLVSGVKLYTISPTGNRPQLRAGMPLSLALYKTFTKKSVVLTSILSKAREETGRKAARECIHDMYLQSINPCYGSFLTDCGRVLAAVIQEKEASRELVERASALLKSLEQEHARLTSECGKL